MLSIVLNISYICALKKPDPIKQNLASEEGDEKLKLQIIIYPVPALPPIVLPLV
jgi:hypothetical protein